jgi:hypothetical protein
MSGTWDLVIPAPTNWISANGREHWARRAEMIRLWRHAGHTWARFEKLPKGLDRVHILAVIRHPAARYDAGNLAPTIKAAVDGLVDYGLVADDDNGHVVGPDIRPGERWKPVRELHAPVGELTLHIEQVPP